MPIAFVKNVGSNTGSGTARTVTVPAAGVALGNVVIVRVFRNGSGGNVSSIVDTGGNTYGTALVATNTTSPTSEVWAATVTTALVSGNTITVTVSASATWGVSVDEFSGLAKTSDGTAGHAQGTSTTPSSNTTPINASDLIYGVCAVASGSSDAFTEDSDNTGGDSWHTLTTVTSSTASHAAYKITTSAVTQTYNPVLGQSRSWTDQVVALKATVPAFISKANRPISQAVQRAVTR